MEEDNNKLDQDTSLIIDTPIPDEFEIKNKIKELFQASNLRELNLRVVKWKLEDLFGCSLDSKKEFINDSVHSMLSAKPNLYSDFALNYVDGDPFSDEPNSAGNLAATKIQSQYRGARCRQKAASQRQNQNKGSSVLSSLEEIENQAPSDDIEKISENELVENEIQEVSELNENEIQEVSEFSTAQRESAIRIQSLQRGKVVRSGIQRSSSEEHGEESQQEPKNITVKDDNTITTTSQLQSEKTFSLDFVEKYKMTPEELLGIGKPELIKLLERIFSDADKENTGTLSPHDFQHCIIQADKEAQFGPKDEHGERHHTGIEKHDAKHICEALDEGHDGIIEYIDFISDAFEQLASIIAVKKVAHEKEVKEAEAFMGSLSSDDSSSDGDESVLSDTKNEVSRSKTEIEQHDAATKIQALQRGRASRRLMCGMEQHDAATKLQAIQRGRASRRFLFEKKMQIQNEQDHAATKLQAIQRGRLSRRYISQRHSAAIKLQSRQRGRIARINHMNKNNFERELQALKALVLKQGNRLVRERHCVNCDRQEDFGKYCRSCGRSIREMWICIPDDKVKQVSQIGPLENRPSQHSLNTGTLGMRAPSKDTKIAMASLGSIDLTEANMATLILRQTKLKEELNMIHAQLRLRRLKILNEKKNVDSMSGRKRALMRLRERKQKREAKLGFLPAQQRALAARRERLSKLLAEVTADDFNDKFRNSGVNAPFDPSVFVHHRGYEHHISARQSIDLNSNSSFQSKAQTFAKDAEVTRVLSNERKRFKKLKMEKATLLENTKREQRKLARDRRRQLKNKLDRSKRKNIKMIETTSKLSTEVGRVQQNRQQDVPPHLQKQIKLRKQMAQNINEKREMQEKLRMQQRQQRQQRQHQSKKKAGVYNEEGGGAAGAALNTHIGIVSTPTSFQREQGVSPSLSPQARNRRLKVRHQRMKEQHQGEEKSTTTKTHVKNTAIPAVQNELSYEDDDASFVSEFWAGVEEHASSWIPAENINDEVSSDNFSPIGQLSEALPRNVASENVQGEGHKTTAKRLLRGDENNIPHNHTNNILPQEWLEDSAVPISIPGLGLGRGPDTPLPGQNYQDANTGSNRARFAAGESNMKPQETRLGHLEFLKELRDEGRINEDEYERRRSFVLAKSNMIYTPFRPTPTSRSMCFSPGEGISSGPSPETSNTEDSPVMFQVVQNPNDK